MLTLRRAQGHRPGHWGPDDYDVMDGDRNVGRIFLQAHGAWFWGLDFMATRHMGYGSTESREDAMAAFRAEYERWQRGAVDMTEPEYLDGRPLSPEELDLIRRQLEQLDDITAITPEMRAIVERNWPHLVAKLPPEDD